MTRLGDQFRFIANVDPSKVRPGMAALATPQVVLYKPGFHGYGRKSGHSAFRQASPVVVWRDGNVGPGHQIQPGLFMDSLADPFWINLHRGGETETNSAGCQTVPPRQWDPFYTMIMRLLTRFGRTTFPYVLL